MKGKVALFTAHAPSGGGGGAILRSLLPELADEFEIFWRYLATEPAPGYERGWLGPPVIGSRGFFSDAIGTASLLAGSQSQSWRALIDKLLSVDCHAYWIVTHNEGLCVARDLRRRTKRPIHLTVHDDWAGALCARSTRYRFLAPLADAVSRRLLSHADSVDVVSRGMQDFYRVHAGAEAVVCHRYLPGLPPASSCGQGSGLMVGHIGSVYSPQELWAFVAAFKAFCEGRGETGKLRLWGCHLRDRDVPQNLAGWVEFHPSESEEVVIRGLQQCQFVYAMYPFTGRLRRFSQTSLPTKLSTYVLAQRPILGHGPLDSSLAEFMRETNLGVFWDSCDLAAGIDAVASVLMMQPPRTRWEAARDCYFGPGNVQRLRACLCMSTATSRLHA